MKINLDRLEFATNIFVRACIRQYARTNPKAAPEDFPVKPLATYPKGQQVALMRAFLEGLNAVDGHDELFQTFLQQKREIEEAKKAEGQ